MGKKIETSKEVATAAAVEKKKPAPAKKVAAKKTAAKKTAVSAKKSAKPAFTSDEVALRAYYIAEKRHKAGIPGESHQDWLEAERQLIAESKKKAPKKAA